MQCFTTKERLGDVLTKFNAKGFVPKRACMGCVNLDCLIAITSEKRKENKVPNKLTAKTSMADNW